jgi:hypothetical protein
MHKKLDIYVFKVINVATYLFNCSQNISEHINIENHRRMYLVQFWQMPSSLKTQSKFELHFFLYLIVCIHKIL